LARRHREGSASSAARDTYAEIEANASQLINEKITELGDWRGEKLGKLRAIIHQADLEVVEEWKWAKSTSPGTPVWSHNGNICTGET
jgi:hypothetical protein